MITDFYRILGVSYDASFEEIKTAYRRLAMEYHPDRNKSPDAEQKFKEICAVYKILSNAEERRKYDKRLFAELKSWFEKKENESSSRNMSFENNINQNQNQESNQYSNNYTYQSNNENTYNTIHENTYKVFSNPTLLREKLAIFFNSTDKVEIYAQAAEEFWRKGNGKDLKFAPTWSWWAFFLPFFFFLYHKQYGISFFSAISILAGIIIYGFNIFCFAPCAVFGIIAKYIIVKNFFSKLEETNKSPYSQMDSLKVGLNDWVLKGFFGILRAVLWSFVFVFLMTIGTRVLKIGVWWAGLIALPITVLIFNNFKDNSNSNENSNSN